MERRFAWLAACAAALFSSACAAQTALPGRLEAEAFASMSGVATEATADMPWRPGRGLDRCLG
ncbi:hypothetical protein LP420_15370 [Massilia sp. B-10]|nr:hypothetical protein LP420_15370 [Massilia sp. B-10]